MFKILVSALAAIALATSVEAACKASTAGHNWDMVIYGSTSCSGTHEEFYGTLPRRSVELNSSPERRLDAGCRCFNVSNTLNDKVKSFSFTAAGRSIMLYKDANCKGSELGQNLICFYVAHCAHTMHQAPPPAAGNITKSRPRARL
jgi:hypothetical protein